MNVNRQKREEEFLKTAIGALLLEVRKDLSRLDYDAVKNFNKLKKEVFFLWESVTSISAIAGQSAERARGEEEEA